MAKLYSPKLHIAFDVDGTLCPFHGPVTADLCMRLRKKGAILWLLSKRDNADEERTIQSTFDMRPVKFTKGSNYISIKRGGLIFIRRHINEKDTLVYVGDRCEDFIVAWMCSAIYCSPEALSEEIFEESKWAMGIMCGGELGDKQFFRSNLKNICIKNFWEKKP
jgi:hypothetical protein